MIIDSEVSEQRKDDFFYRKIVRDPGHSSRQSLPGTSSLPCRDSSLIKKSRRGNRFGNAHIYAKLLDMFTCSSAHMFMHSHFQISKFQISSIIVIYYK